MTNFYFFEAIDSLIKEIATSEIIATLIGYILQIPLVANLVDFVKDMSAAYPMFTQIMMANLVWMLITKLPQEIKNIIKFAKKVYAFFKKTVAQNKTITVDEQNDDFTIISEEVPDFVVISEEVPDFIDICETVA